MAKVKKCPNCGSNMEFILGKWTCFECEYHDEKPKKKIKESFR